MVYIILTVNSYPYPYIYAYEYVCAVKNLWKNKSWKQN